MIFNYIDGLPKPADKFGTVPVQAGINSGYYFISIANMNSVSKSSVSNGSNVDIPGVWMFQTNGRNFAEPNICKPKIISSYINS